MKKLFIVVMLVAVLFSCKKEQSYKEGAERGYIVKVGELAPDFTTKLMDGTSFTLSAQKGKVVMLQFTASWCSICRKEMPFIEKEIYQLHKDKDFVLVGLDRDEPLEKMQALAKATGISYPLAFDPKADIFALYADKRAGVTRNVIINREGKIIYMTRLFNREEFDVMKKVIAQELKKNSQK